MISESESMNPTLKTKFSDISHVTTYPMPERDVLSVKLLHPVLLIYSGRVNIFTLNSN